MHRLDWGIDEIGVKKNVMQFEISLLREWKILTVLCVFTFFVIVILPQTNLRNRLILRTITTPW